MSPARRRFSIALLALIAVVLFWLAPDPDIPEPAGVVPASSRGLPDAVRGRLPALHPWPVKVAIEPLQESMPETAEAETESLSTEVRSAAGSGGAAVPAQQAPPPLPFRYIGRLASDGGAKVFLTARGETASAEAGATLSGGWRLDSILQDRLDFTHVPTDTRQSLNIIKP